MGRLFEDRERAAEGIFAHDEEGRFVAHRRGITALAAWAAESMGLDDTMRAAYTDRLLTSFVSGTHENEIVAAVQTDLERAGKPALSGQAGLVLSQAVAEATAAAHPHPDGHKADPRGKDHVERAAPRKPPLGWSL